MIDLLRRAKGVFARAVAAFVAFSLLLAASDVAMALPGLPQLPIPLPKRHPHPHPAAELSLSAIAGALVLAGCLVLLLRRTRRRAN